MLFRSVRDVHADIELCDRLVKSGHMSPSEHVARPMTLSDAELLLCKSGVTGIDIHDIDVRQVFCGNYSGWVQLRHGIPHEADFSARPNE